MATNPTSAPALPTRAAALASAAGFGAIGGALVGSAEAARVAVGGLLALSGSQIGALFAVGTTAGAVIGLIAGAAVGVLPVRPRGRTQWSGFLVGVAAPLVARAGVWWFSDPPPFTDPFPGQGNPLAFLGVLVGVAVVVAVLYQAARGARAVGGAALVVAAGLAAWVQSGAAGPGAPQGRAPAGAPNVLLVTLDTTRADRLDAYGGEVAAPHFDDVARGGALFLDASAVAAVTGPSHATMLTGAGPWDHGVLLNGVPIPTDRTTLAEVLHANGYHTGAFVSSYVLDGDKGFARGFEAYDDDFGWLKGSSDLVVVQLYDMVVRHFAPEEELERRGGDTVDAALGWMSRQDGATFTWVHLFDAHGPYEPPPPYDTRYYSGDPRDPANTSMAPVKNVAAYLKKSLEGITDLKWVLAQYDGEIAYADEQLGRLLAAVDPQNTLVIVIGDHGEQLGEHDVWFNHGDDVYESSVHVPFAMRWPGRVTAGQRVEQPFEGTDLSPTILEIVGVAKPPSMVGVSAAGLVGAGEGKGRKLARSLCFDREANVKAREAGEIEKPKFRMAGIRDHSGRYVERETGRPEEYFDLTTDPTGLTDVINLFQQTPDGSALLKLYEHTVANEVFAGDAAERSAIDVGDEERRRLEALGYLDGTAAEGAP